MARRTSSDMQQALRAVDRALSDDEPRTVGHVLDRLSVHLLSDSGLSEYTAFSYADRARRAIRRYAKQHTQARPKEPDWHQCKVNRCVFEYRIKGRMCPEDLLTVSQHILGEIAKTAGSGC